MMTSMTSPRLFARAGALALALLWFASLTACSGTSGQMAAQGAGRGAAAGAVGGMLTAVIFGGDPVEAAARGAVWAGSAGAVSGAIQGSQVDAQKAARQEQSQIARVRSEIGDDSFEGLTALVDCKHQIALGYAKQARTARNRDHALAGLWLEIITYADGGDQTRAQGFFPKLIEQDPNVSSDGQATKTLGEALQGLADIRKHYGLKTKCRGMG
jgi:hypothetical protein